MQSDKFSSLFDRNPHVQPSFEQQYQQPRSFQSNIHHQPRRISQKKVLDYSRIANAARPDGGRVYLSSMFNADPRIISRLRQVEDSHEAEVINPRGLNFTGTKAPAIDRSLQPNAVMRYKKERFENGKVRPATVEIVTETLPADDALVTPAQRREMFRAEIETQKAQKLLRQEEGEIQRRITLRRRGMESAVMGGEFDPLDKSAGLSEAQIRFREEAIAQDRAHREKRRQVIGSIYKSNLPIGDTPPPDSSRRPITPLSDLLSVPSGRLRGRGMPPKSQMDQITNDDWRRPTIRVFVPKEHERNIITHAINKPTVFQDDGGDPLRTRSAQEGLGRFQREREKYASPYMEEAKERTFKSTNEMMRYPSSVERAVEHSPAQVQPRHQPVGWTRKRHIQTASASHTSALASLLGQGECTNLREFQDGEFRRVRKPSPQNYQRQPGELPCT
ncbi:hypothetical protein BLNAU_20046 [Blattamonas nauphoetae]|uniref:Uncharacterized protein n=1 Tax=Blattamonas nauphoetae TaxID=2049346 RepID=A0ABQ9X0D2_9EUKA|nr:hypothetical protein BLNAU_20046 [Blattamonas nauphoetae]